MKSDQELIWARLSDRAKKVLLKAAVDADNRGHKYIGTEHILMGIVKEGEGIAAGVLDQLGVTEKIGPAVDFIVGGDKNKRFGRG